MHHSLKIKILDLDHLESIFEQNITDVETEKIVGGALSLSGSQVAVGNLYAIGRTLSDGLESVMISNGTIVHVVPFRPHPHPAWHWYDDFESLLSSSLQYDLSRSNFNSQLNIGLLSGF